MFCLIFKIIHFAGNVSATSMKHFSRNVSIETFHGSSEIFQMKCLVRHIIAHETFRKISEMFQNQRAIHYTLLLKRFKNLSEMYLAIC